MADHGKRNYSANEVGKIVDMGENKNDYLPYITFIKNHL